MTDATPTHTLTAAIYYWVNRFTLKGYIGSSIQLSRRFHEHLLRSSNKELREDLQVDGIESFSFGVFEFISFPIEMSKKDIKPILLEREQFYIDLYLKDHKLKLVTDASYNKNPLAKSPLGRVVTDEARRRMSTSAKKKKLTDSHKKAISENHCSKKEGWVSWAKGRKLPPEHKEKLSVFTNKAKKAVARYDFNGEFSGAYNSYADAARTNNYPDATNIIKCVAKHTKTYKGYYWRQITSDLIPQYIAVPKPPKVLVLDTSLVTVGVFDNPYQIEKKLGIHHTVVAACLRSNKPTLKHGYFFEYEKQHDNTEEKTA